jgi:hypothetical protein
LQEEIVMNEAAASRTQLKRGLVVTVDTMQVTGVKKVLDLPSVGYELRFSTADIRDLPPEHFAVFAAEFAERFNGEFAFLRRKWFADMRQVVRQTEAQLSPLGKQSSDLAAAVRAMGPMVDRANDDLRQRCAGYAVALQAHGQACYQAALRVAWRAAKRRSGQSSVKVVAEFELTAPVPPAVPNVAVSRYVVMPTPRHR